MSEFNAVIDFGSNNLRIGVFDSQSKSIYSSKVTIHESLNNRDLNNYLNLEINEDNAKKINGLITEYLDQIPQANLCIEIDNYRFEIIEIDNNFISKIKIKKA